MTVYISISAFASFIDISEGIMSFTIGLNIYVIIAMIKEYNPIFRKKKKNNDEIELLAKTNLDCIKNSYDYMKEESTKLET